jgi:ATP-dependent protease ClpP protease subunit
MLYAAANEYPFDQAKRSWQSRHRWTRPAVETWNNLTGELTDRAITQIINGLEPDAPLVLSIDSDGGDPVAAFDLYHALRAHPAPVTTIAGPQCHSAAIIAYLAGDNRIASRDSRSLVHGTASNPVGRPSAQSLRAGADFLADMDQAIETLITLPALL